LPTEYSVWLTECDTGCANVTYSINDLIKELYAEKYMQEYTKKLSITHCEEEKEGFASWPCNERMRSSGKRVDYLCPEENTKSPLNQFLTSLPKLVCIKNISN
jgi:hypothetical protein